jgi:hypothetical protein
MTTPSHTESPTHLDLAHSWFEFVEKGDMDGLASILSDNLTHDLLPASMELPAGMEHRSDKERHLKVCGGAKWTMDFYNVLLLAFFFCLTKAPSFTPHKKSSRAPIPTPSLFT